MRARTTDSRLQVDPLKSLVIVTLCIGWVAPLSAQDTYQPRRINKCIELLEEGQPIYYIAGGGGYEEGKALAKTWADMIMYDMEHDPFDPLQLREFMQGLVDGGPTPSGHRTPTVVVTLPVLGLDKETMKAGSWVTQQVLAQGVHGLHLCHARDSEAVKEFVRSVRYPIHHQEIDTLGEGLRGYMSQRYPAKIWDVSEDDYIKMADVWPLNPKGEIILGVKLEDRHALPHADDILQVPGLCFGEWGPRDMGLSYGYLGGQADPPFPKEMQEAGDRVLKACKDHKVFFLDNVLPQNVAQRIEEGVMIGAGRRQDSAEAGRKHTKRRMPW